MILNTKVLRGNCSLTLERKNPSATSVLLDVNKLQVSVCFKYKRTLSTIFFDDPNDPNDPDDPNNPNDPDDPDDPDDPNDPDDEIKGEQRGGRVHWCSA